MAMTLSSPKRASGTRCANEITTTTDKIDEMRVQSPIVNQNSTVIERA